MELKYKKAIIEDIPTLISIEQSIVGSKTYSAMLEESEWIKAINDGPVYIIEKDSKIAGDVMYEMKSPDHAYISGILILPEFQRQGIARQAMDYILKEIGEVKRIDLVTHPDNFKAISLYESLGFKIESRKEDYFGDGEPRVVMAR
ncbi:MAG: acetyltransferase [Candidatus Nomurabacteria bacterium]|nr:acetyltransferase [Candidatus Nomurabacteria bacterium]